MFLTDSARLARLRIVRGIVVLGLASVASSNGIAQSPNRGPTVWNQLRNSYDNAGAIPGTLSVSWSYKAPQRVRGISVAGNLVVVGTEPPGADVDYPTENSPGSVIAIDLRSGREVWMREMPSWVHGDPAIYHDRVFATFGRVPAAASQGGLYALDAKTGKTIWTFETASGIMPGPYVDTAQSTVTIVGGDAALYFLDASSGVLRGAWGLHAGDDMSSPHVDTTGVLFVGSGLRVTAYSMREHRLRWSTKLTDELSIADIPVAVGEKSVFTTGTRLVGIKAAFHVLPLTEFFSLARASARLHPISRSATWFAEQDLIALDKHTGNQLWARPLGTGLPIARNHSGAPVIAGSRVIVASPASKKVFAFDIASGARVWVRTLDDVPKGPVTIVGEDVIVVGGGGQLTMLRLTDGSVLGSCRAAGFTVTTPVVVGQTLFAATSDHWLYARPYDDFRKRVTSPGSKACF
jgi:outer membrane protein assembly factor BamB